MSVNTADVIGNWTVGRDSFAVDSPNAVLVVDKSERQADIIVELFNPVYDSTTKTLKYDITIDNTRSIELPSKFELATLVIDTKGTSYTGTYIDKDNFGAINVK